MLRMQYLKNRLTYEVHIWFYNTLTIYRRADKLWTDCVKDCQFYAPFCENCTCIQQGCLYLGNQFVWNPEALYMKNKQTCIHFFFRVIL